MIDTKLIPEMNFNELKEILVPVLDRLSIITHENNDNSSQSEYEFSVLLGQLATGNIPRPSTQVKIDRMQLIYNYQYNMCGSFEKNILYTMYSSSEDNLARLFIAFPEIGLAFKMYGRVGTGVLKEDIEKLKLKLSKE